MVAVATHRNGCPQSHFYSSCTLAQALGGITGSSAAQLEGVIAAALQQVRPGYLELSDVSVGHCELLPDWWTVGA